MRKFSFSDFLWAVFGCAFLLLAACPVQAAAPPADDPEPSCYVSHGFWVAIFFDGSEVFCVWARCGRQYVWRKYYVECFELEPCMAAEWAAGQ